MYNCGNIEEPLTLSLFPTLKNVLGEGLLEFMKGSN